MHIYVKFCESVPEEKCYLNAFEPFSFPHGIISFLIILFSRFFYISLRSERFRSVSEQRETEERDCRFWPREKWNESRSFTRAIFRAVFDSRSSFFAPKPHGNACYAGYFYLKLLFTDVFLEL